MNDILDPPGERDLPAGRQERIRARVLDSVQHPERHTARRLVLVAAVTAVAAGTVGAIRWNGDSDWGVSAMSMAMSTSELSPNLRKAAGQCLEWNRDEPDSVRVTLDDVAVAAQREYDSALLFLTDDGFYSCSVRKEPSMEVTGGSRSDIWSAPQREWLPGPIQRLGGTSSDVDGGDVTVIGRASARVDKLLLDYGDGHTTAARLQDGAFGLISDGMPVRPDARLVSYDRDGNEIDRRPLFNRQSDYEHCYVDPAGTVVYRKDRTETTDPDPRECQPADRWDR
jgi:hypothetical protein